MRASVLPKAAKTVPLKKALRQVPQLSPAQSKFYQCIGSSTFSLESLAKCYAHFKQK